MLFSTKIIVAMVLLACWASIHIIKFLQIRRHEPKGTIRYFFWEMNGLWNIVNALIAFGSLVFLVIAHSAINESQSLQLLLTIIVLVNVILDGMYIAIGIWLKRPAQSPRRQGYGKSLVLQGSFLLVFDLLLSQVLLLSTLNAFA